jgi:hypothetical protein
MTSIDTAEALFASYLQPSDHPTSAQVTAAVRDSLRRLGGQSGCAAVRATGMAITLIRQRRGCGGRWPSPNTTAYPPS